MLVYSLPALRHRVMFGPMDRRQIESVYKVENLTQRRKAPKGRTSNSLRAWRLCVGQKWSHGTLYTSSN
jgi:hypothetical protein